MRYPLALLALAMTLGACAPAPAPPVRSGAAKVKLGVDVFFEKHLDLVRGKNVGLVTNPSGVDGGLRATAERFAACPDFRLVALYGPEHGIRGNAQAGESVPFYYDDKFKAPVFSLYGQSLKPDPAVFKDMDAFMRSYDTMEAGKIPEADMVKGIDVLVFDIQDVGTRIYTYVATMAYLLDSCAATGTPFVVLDRPNPINGMDLEGPILEYPEFSSFVGLYPVPVRHGLTIGELARLFNDKYAARKAALTVVPMEGWSRDLWHDQTGLPWVIPSPNMPTPDTAAVYPGQVFIEGTNLSEGRGTTRPFEFAGAPWIDGYDLAAKLNALHPAGVIFREAWFTPSFSKFQGELCGGVQLHVTDRTAYRPLATALLLIKTVRDLYPGKLVFHRDYFDKIMGTAKVREALESGADVASIVAGLQPGLDAFRALRAPYLLYD